MFLDIIVLTFPQCFSLSFLPLLQGHKRAPSDVSIASSEDEKVPLSPSILESVPEKAEPVPPMPTPTDVATRNVEVKTSSVEEPATSAAEEGPEEVPNAPAEDGEVEQNAVKEELPEVGGDDASPEKETEPEPPMKEMQQLEITVENEKEVDTAEVLADQEATTGNSLVTEAPQEEMVCVVEESKTPAEEVKEAKEEEEDKERYKHLKVTLTLPEQDKVVSKEENQEKPREKNQMNADDEKKVPDKAKDEKERDSESGSGPAADNSSIDLNLSISSFLSKTKEPGSVSIQVTHSEENKPKYRNRELI